MPKDNPVSCAAATDEIVQVEVWLLGISQRHGDGICPVCFTLRELLVMTRAMSSQIASVHNACAALSAQLSTGFEPPISTSQTFAPGVSQILKSDWN
jgi:hypothetical protein